MGGSNANLVHMFGGMGWDTHQHPLVGWLQPSGYGLDRHELASGFLLAQEYLTLCIHGDETCSTHRVVQWVETNVCAG